MNILIFLIFWNNVLVLFFKFRKNSHGIFQTLNCSLEELTYPVTMTTISCSLNTIMQPWIFCRVMFTKVSTTITTKMTHNQVSIGLLYCTFPLTAITFCHISPNPMAIPKLFLQDQNNIFRKIKIFVSEIAKVKVQ